MKSPRKKTLLFKRRWWVVFLILVALKLSIAGIRGTLPLHDALWAPTRESFTARASQYLSSGVLGQAVAAFSLIPLKSSSFHALFEDQKSPAEAWIIEDRPPSDESSRESHEIPLDDSSSSLALPPDHVLEETTVGLNLIHEVHPWPTPSPLLRWTPDPRARVYTLQIDDSEQCTSPLAEVTIAPVNDDSPPPTRYKYPGYLANGHYWICLKSLSARGDLLSSHESALEVRAHGYGDPLVFNGHTTHHGNSPFIRHFSHDVNFLFAKTRPLRNHPTQETLGFGRHFSIFSDPNDEFVLKMFVVDSLFHRILIFNSLPATDNAKPDLVMGQPDFETSSYPGSSEKAPSNVSPLTLKEPSHVSVCQDGRLLVTDQGHHRILVWNTIPQDLMVPPDEVIGQQDLWSQKSATGPANLQRPVAAFCTPRGILVADAGHHRLLLFDLDKKDSATVVIGQKDFTTTKHQCHQGSLSQVEDLWIDGERLIIADTLHHRILVFHEFPSHNGAQASAVLGQKNFDTCLPNQGLDPQQISSDTLFEPSSLRFYKHHLLVSDRKNMRILVFPWLKDHVASEAVDLVGADHFGPPSDQFLILAPNSSGGSPPVVGGVRQPLHGLYVSDEGIWTMAQGAQQLVRLRPPSSW